MKTKNLAVSIIVAVLVVALWWTMLLKPTRAKVAKAKSDTTAQEAKLAPLQQQLSQAQRDAAHAAEFKAQLQTTALFPKAADAAKFAASPDLKKTMEQVRTFTFSKGLFGKGAKSKDFVGMEFPDKSVLGDAKNVKLRFDSSVMQLAADGKL